MPTYGSGGFTSYDDGQMAAQLVGWVEWDGRVAPDWGRSGFGLHFTQQDAGRYPAGEAR